MGSMEKTNSIRVLGARVHNLQNIDLELPRGELVVFTGLSGSGKSSLAFDTIHAEGQRRYMETFSAYARHFVGNMERPDVDLIEGLSPVISIEQKSTNNNPRSTVGTLTDTYDLLRLLYARIGKAYSIASGKPMVKYSEEKILEIITSDYGERDIMVLAPLVKGRKGHYRELFEQVAKRGFLKVRVDGEVRDITYRMQVDRYKVHDIELVVDRLRASSHAVRLREAVQTAFRQGKGVLMVLDTEVASGRAPKSQAGERPAVRYFSRMLMDPDSGLSYPEPEPNTFSFNSPYGACPHCNGLGEVAHIDMRKLVPDPSRSLRDGAIELLGKYSPTNYIYRRIELMARHYGFTLDDPFESLSPEAVNALLYGSNHIEAAGGEEGMGMVGEFNGIANYITSLTSEDSPASLKKWAASFMNTMPCPECHGHRLKPESLAFRILDKNIGQLAEMDLAELQQWLSALEPQLDNRDAAVAHEVLVEVLKRLSFLNDVGVGYLSMNRSAKSLSGGEAQRIRLATQIGSQLTNVLYILDEPSIGLHQRDNRRLIESLKRLRDLGNSVIVVEHDRDMMLEADYLVDIGPGAGVGGGKVLYAGRPKAEGLTNQNSSTSLTSPNSSTIPASLTLDYLSRRREIALPERRQVEGRQHLVLRGATGNNLCGDTFDLPLGMLVCVTGVSGSGKSSLVGDTLLPILSQHFYRSLRTPLPYEAIEGMEHIDKVIEIDQSPIGRTPRSNPATYAGFFDDIRRLFAELPSARIRGYKPGRFSFNVSGGRCEHCKGAGLRTIEMNFLPDVYVQCEMCGGKRYNRETLEIRYKGKSVADVLDMTVAEAVDFFDAYPKLRRKLQALLDVGLGYITLGQQSTTLSGGEAQRVKLATELGRVDTGRTLYILDEPTTGLHFEDIRVLLGVLQKLVDKGNTVLVIEHNMDVIKVADWVIDLGPDGGRAGGHITFCGTPEQLACQPHNFTGQFLKAELEAMRHSAEQPSAGE